LATVDDHGFDGFADGKIHPENKNVTARLPWTFWRVQKHNLTLTNISPPPVNLDLPIPTYLLGIIQ